MRRVVLLLTVMAATLVLASGVALAVAKIGTNGPDTLRGTNGNDDLSGRDGQDDLFSLNGIDNMLGGAGRDNVWAGNERRPGAGDKNLQGGSGNDAVLGGFGTDSLLGGTGNDLVDGYRGPDNIVGDEGTDLLIDGGPHEAYKDHLSGGPGNDVFDVENRPPFGDRVTCGSGFDRVAADSKDVVAADCEKVAVGPAATKALFKEIPKAEKQAFNQGLPPQP
jgi:Ca2+-binding RTX toxin-like protein